MLFITTMKRILPLPLDPVRCWKLLQTMQAPVLIFVLAYVVFATWKGRLRAKLGSLVALIRNVCAWRLEARMGPSGKCCSRPPPEASDASESRAVDNTGLFLRGIQVQSGSCCQVQGVGTVTPAPDMGCVMFDFGVGLNLRGAAAPGPVNFPC